MASLKIGAIERAGNLVDIAYDTLMAAKYQDDPRLRSALSNYRELAGKIQRQYQIAIANLADDLRESCRPKKDNFRAEVGAILWSLGMIPESRLFSQDANSAFVPSRRLFKRIVEQSLACIPHDPLVQYVWLQLKDRPPFNIRDHKSLFGKINARYAQMMLDELGPASPSELYARNLIGSFRGNLSKDQVAEFLSAYDLVKAGFPGLVDWSVYLRIDGLAHILAKRFGFFASPMTEQEELDYWYWIGGLAASVRENANLHPEWPELHSRSTLGLFHCIEAELSRPMDSAGAPVEAWDKIVSAMEKIRAGALSYWLKVVPPLLSAAEQSNLASLLERESQLLSYLRGAYFLVLYPILPSHYRRYGVMLDDVSQIRGDEKAKKFDPDVGREQYKELNDELKDLYLEMQQTSPRYARKRLEPKANLNDLVNALRSHAPQGKFRVSSDE